MESIVGVEAGVDGLRLQRIGIMIGVMIGVVRIR